MLNLVPRDIDGTKTETETVYDTKQIGNLTWLDVKKILLFATNVSENFLQSDTPNLIHSSFYTCTLNVLVVLPLRIVSFA